MCHITNAIGPNHCASTIKRTTDTTLSSTDAISAAIGFNSSAININASYTGEGTIFSPATTDTCTAIGMNFTTTYVDIINCRIIRMIINP